MGIGLIPGTVISSGGDGSRNSKGGANYKVGRGETEYIYKCPTSAEANS